MTLCASRDVFEPPAGSSGGRSAVEQIAPGSGREPHRRRSIRNGTPDTMHQSTTCAAVSPFDRDVQRYSDDVWSSRQRCRVRHRFIRKARTSRDRRERALTHVAICLGAHSSRSLSDHSDHPKPLVVSGVQVVRQIHRADPRDRAPASGSCFYRLNEEMTLWIVIQPGSEAPSST